MQTSLAELQKFGWRYQAGSNTSHVMPEHISARYQSLPNELLSFLGSFCSCADPADTSWFISFDTARYPGAFQYNEFELMSLEGAADGTSFAASVRAFWDGHFPILLSVAGSYQYFAYVLHGPEQGSVVYGYEPEFEEPAAVAPSLSEFLALLHAAVRSELPPYPFSHALGQRA